MTISENDIFQRKENIVMREIAGEVLIVPVSGELAEMDRIFALNDVGGLVWQTLETGINVQMLVDKVVEKFEVDSSTARNDIVELLKDFKDAELIDKIL